MEGERELEVKRFPLDELLAQYRGNPRDFADGAGRILDKLNSDSVLHTELIQLMEELSRPERN